MPVKLAINGFGRIGRTVLRALSERQDSDLQLIAVNDLAPIETLAHLFEFDSLHGRYPGPVSHHAETLDIGHGPIRVTAEPDPANLPWADVDIVLECTGTLRSANKAARHHRNGSGKVLVSAPAGQDVKTIIQGVNHDQITAQDRLLSNASCTTNCLVPVAHVLHEAFGLARGHMTTVHCYTGSQSLHDRAQPDLTRARAGALSMVPTTSGSAEMLGQVLPHLKGRITSTAIRVPTPNVSCCDLVVETKTPIRADEVTAAMQRAADGPLKGILGIESRPLVSIDYARDPRSAIYAADQTEVQQDNLLRVLAWYDNEWAFAHRMLDVATRMGR